MKRFWPLALLLFSGCFEYRETITVNTDGGVEISVLSSVLESVVPFLKNRPEYTMLLGTLAGGAVLQKMLPQGATVVRAKTVTAEGWVHSDLDLHFDSVQNLANGGSTMLKGQEIKWFQEADGAWYYERTVFKPDMTTIPGGLGQKLQEKYWREARMHFEITTPLKVRGSNGVRRTDNTIVWDADMALVKERGLRLWVRFEPAPVDQLQWLWVGGVALFLMLVGGFFQWRRRRSVHS